MIILQYIYLVKNKFKSFIVSYFWVPKKCVIFENYGLYHNLLKLIMLVKESTSCYL